MGDPMQVPAAAPDGPRINLGGLADNTGFLLRLAQLHAFEAFFKAFEGRSLRPGEYAVLAAIRRNPGIRQGVLAGVLRIKRSNMAKMVRAFQDRGLVSGRVPDDDRRGVELRLLGPGRALVDRLEPEVAAHDRAAFAMLTGAERAALTALLRKLVDTGTETP